jgi:proline dehydrogenase
LGDAFRVEAAGWKGALGSALALDPKVGAFYAQFAHAACELGLLRIGILRIGDHAAAMHLAVEQDGCFWLLKMGFDESFARFSPGTLLLVESLRQARERGCHRYELMGSSEAWNRIWTQRSHEAVAVSLCAASARGWINVIAEHTAGAVRKALHNRMGDYSLGRRLRRMVVPMVRFAARSYVAGPELKDALEIARKLAADGRASTIGFWDDVGAATGDVLDAYLKSAQALQTEVLDGYISVKAPSLQYSRDAFLQLIGVCKGSQTRLHFDSLWLESADPTQSLIDDLRPRYDHISCTLPGRWQRSLKDAEWAINRGLSVRVVKGQWADPAMPPLDPHQGFLDVVERLAGRARSVAVATHCPRLAAAALELLMKAGTLCELELLFGLPSNAVLKIADAMGVRTRVYVPYGCGWIPYSLLQVRRNPRILWWILKDAMRKKSWPGIRA